MWEVAYRWAPREGPLSTLCPRYSPAPSIVSAFPGAFGQPVLELRGQH